MSIFPSVEDNNATTTFKNNYMRIKKFLMYLSYILQITHEKNHKLINKRTKNYPGTQPNNRSCAEFYHGFQLWFLTYTKY